MMTKERAYYDREIKKKAVELSYARDNAKGKPKPTVLDQENARLRKKWRDATIERDIFIKRLDVPDSNY